MKLFNTLQIIIGFVFQGIGLFQGMNWELIAIGNLTMQVGASMMYLYEKPLKSDGKLFNNTKNYNNQIK